MSRRHRRSPQRRETPRLQEHGAGNRLWAENWNGLPPFDRSAEPIAVHLTDGGFSEQDGEYLSMGPAAGERFGRRRFMEMTAVLTATPAGHTGEKQRSEDERARPVVRA